MVGFMYLYIASCHYAHLVTAHLLSPSALPEPLIHFPPSLTITRFYDPCSSPRLQGRRY
uniref:Uncharacterized protein n=1 Tax=Anguilla anguilla TaxID=7936 RepID=A0A0E9PL89_ANGAN